MAIRPALGGVDPIALVVAFGVIVAVGLLGCTFALRKVGVRKGLGQTELMVLSTALAFCRAFGLPTPTGSVTFMDGTTSIRPAECLNASSIRTFLFCTSFTKGEVVMTAVSVLSIPDP